MTTPVSITYDPGAPGGDFSLAQIGPHRLYCADAYALLPTLGWFDALCMDPPYKFNASGGGAFRAARGATDQIVEESLDQGFDLSIINPLMCGAVVTFCHNDQLPEVLPFLNGMFHRFALLIWTKPNPSPMCNKHYLADTEPFIHAWSRGWHPQGGHHAKHRWVNASPLPSKTYGHPTVKPDSLMSRIVTNIAGQTICDPFMGTGSTGVAAIRAGRTFTGIEHNPTHFATAVQRCTAAWEEAQKGGVA
jgi:site-specific DNA-methyltransferase (adenine-specific)